MEGKKLILIVVVVTVLLIVGIVGALNFAKTQQAYTAQECQNVQVPYTEQECQTVQVPYSDQACQDNLFAYNVKTTACTQYSSGLFGLGAVPAKVTCTVNNLENKMGEFTMTYGLVLAGTPISYTESITVYAMGSASRSYSYNGQMQNCICQATPPTYQTCQTVTKYRTERQCHDVTKYRSETQCHDVTKYRTISMWKSLFG